MWPPRPPRLNLKQPFAYEDYEEQRDAYDAYLNQLDDERKTPRENDDE